MTALFLRAGDRVQRHNPIAAWLANVGPFEPDLEFAEIQMVENDGFRPHAQFVIIKVHCDNVELLTQCDQVAINLGG